MALQFFNCPGTGCSSLRHGRSRRVTPSFSCIIGFGEADFLFSGPSRKTDRGVQGPTTIVSGQIFLGQPLSVNQRLPHLPLTDFSSHFRAQTKCLQHVHPFPLLVKDEQVSALIPLGSLSVKTARPLGGECTFMRASYSFGKVARKDLVKKPLFVR